MLLKPLLKKFSNHQCTLFYFCHQQEVLSIEVLECSKLLSLSDDRGSQLRIGCSTTLSKFVYYSSCFREVIFLSEAKFSVVTYGNLHFINVKL